MVDKTDLSQKRIDGRPPHVGAGALVIASEEGSPMWWTLAAVAVSAGALTGWFWRRRLTYVALGDSIAFGIGSLTLTGYPQRFAVVLHRRLGQLVTLQNLSVFGLTSGELLGSIESDERWRTAIRKAGLITINIGGNDLLRCNYQGSCLPGALQTFRANWEGILREIRILNPKAPIYTFTLYNPYPLDDVRRPPVAEGIGALNAIVTDPGLVSAYQVNGIADVAGAFRGQECDWTWFCRIGDVHPTDAGHAAIAQALGQLLAGPSRQPASKISPQGGN
jgi:lysophospholipase L1-like esterase